MFAITKSQNASHLLRKRELGVCVSFKNFRDRRLLQNINQRNYSKTIYNGHELAVIAFDVQEHLAATLGWDNKVKLWNLDTGKCQWTFNPEPKVHWKEVIKIVEGKIVCSGLAETSGPFKYNKTIRIIDLDTGDEVANITDSKLDVQQICILGKRLFCVLKDGKFGEWDLEGRAVRLIDSEGLDGSPARFLGFGNFLIHTASNIVLIHDLQKNSKRRIAFKMKDEKPNIMSAYMDEYQGRHRLICGLNNLRERTFPDCCVIDLESGNVTSQYQATGAFVHTEIDRYNYDRPYSTESGAIWKVLANEEWVYLGHSTGTVVAVNLANKTHVVLGKHKNDVFHLSRQGQILISGSEHNCHHLAELKIWNLKTMTKIAEMELLSLSKISFVSEKVFAAVERSLIQWDYLVHTKTKC